MKNNNSFVLRILAFALLLLLSGCIAIRVYIPKQGTDAFDIGNLDTIPHLAIPHPNPQFEIGEAPHLGNATFARRVSSLFFLAPDKLENEYGSIGVLLRRELDRNRNDYKTNGKYRIFVKDFELKTDDHCFSGSVTGVKLAIEVTDLSKNTSVLDFQYADSIESNVTDCHFTLATATIVGWLIYMPYLGFRGNREDQLNQLGRTALLEFSEKLKFSLRKKTEPATSETKKEIPTR
ncbi:hypothetical protein LFX25_11830 [Leptospira sp. FAT2]|uniref:hypothetical protein n=1 Tax=Leptospira sanjuanensis TaxID=2879643 RepID=UPI001EE8FD37|nr:hypothetical protein [Leptospira sanjuanensis]MCG6193933.1 hypothetical protein [Leptospira sanjuanensis]